MRNPLSALLALATAFAISPAALADNFDFSFSTIYSTAPAFGVVYGEGAYGYGTLSGAEVSPGVYQITSGTIVLFGGSDTYAAGTGTLVANPTPGVQALSPLGVFKFDDLLYISTTPGTQGQELDSLGLLFWVDDSEVGIWGNAVVNNGNGAISGNGAASNSYSITEFANYLAKGDVNDADAISANIGDFNATPADAPERSSLLLLGTGLMGLLFWKRQFARC